MATQFLGTRYQSFKDDGTVNAGGSVYFYETGTSTAKTTYSDSALSVANANPVVLNSAGAADIWYTGDADVTVKDSTGTTIDSYTSINPTTSTSITESNFIANGSFEDGGSTTPTGWTRSTPPSGGTSAQDTDSAHGLYSWKFTSAGSGAGNLITDAFFNVAEGRTFDVIWQMKSSVADVRNLVEIVWYDDADAEISASSLYDDSATNPTSWTTKNALATPVSTAVRAKFRLTGCHSSDATPGSTWFDGVLVTESPEFPGTPSINLAGGQIKFPATQNASSDVNTLDDYEESDSWTPTITFNTPGDLSVSYTTQTGTYTKVGRQVIATIYIATSTFTHSTASGALVIGGFPHTISANTLHISTLTFQGITKANYTQFSIRPSGASTTANVSCSGSAQAFALLAAADMPTGGNVILQGTVIYHV